MNKSLEGDRLEDLTCGFSALFYNLHRYAFTMNDSSNIPVCPQPFAVYGWDSQCSGSFELNRA